MTSFERRLILITKWIAGAVAFVVFLKVSVPHILEDEGPVGLLMVGVLIGLFAALAISDRQKAAKPVRGADDDEVDGQR